MFNRHIENRFQAFLVHLLCSALVALLVLVLVFVIWYPGLIAPATGVDEIFYIVLGVDVCLGPLLTLVIFNPKKKELRRDLLIICTVQIAALLYGIYTVGVVRPVYVVFEVDRFQIIYANDLDEDSLAEASRDEYKSIPWFGPKWITSITPGDIEERNELLFSVIDGGDDLAKLPRYYAPYIESKQEIIEKANPLIALKDFNLTKPDKYEELIGRYSSESAHVGFLPLKGFVLDLVVVVDKTSAEVLELVDLRPWGN